MLYYAKNTTSKIQLQQSYSVKNSYQKCGQQNQSENKSYHAQEHLENRTSNLSACLLLQPNTEYIHPSDKK